MTDMPNTLDKYRLPLDRDRMKQAAQLAGPALAFARRNPFILIGAAVLGAAGVMAWRNRERIAATAQPLIEDAKMKGEALIEDAKAKGEELIEQAKTAGEAVAAKVTRTRKASTTPEATELH
jgi:hypothetical protein